MLDAERCVLTLHHGSTRRKIIQIQWESGPHGIGYFVHLAYFKYDQGLLGKYRLHGPAGTSQTTPLTEGGQTTRHRIKFVHHADGEAHFSGDKKVQTRIRLQTRPLADYIGHAFTMSYEGLDAFDEATAGDSPRVSSRRSVVDIGWAPAGSDAKDIGGDVVGFFVPLDRVAQLWVATTEADSTRPIRWRWKDTEYTGTVLHAPSTYPGSIPALAIGYRNRQMSGEWEAPSLAFYGGFADVGAATAPDAYVDYLSLAYADRGADFDELERLLGSIDLDVPAPNVPNQDAGTLDGLGVSF